MPVSGEPLYGASLIQGVGSFHRTDLARLNRNRRRLSPVQRRIVDLASMKNYKTPDSLYNALYQATQHPHLTAELVPKPLQANPATFLIASEGADTLRGLVDGHSDHRSGGPKGGPGHSPGSDRSTPPIPPVQTNDAQTQDPIVSGHRTQTDHPTTRTQETQDPITSGHRTQTEDVPTSDAQTQDPSTSAGETQTDDRVTGKRKRQDDSTSDKRRKLNEPSSEELPRRRGSSRVPPWVRHRRDVNVRRYTQGVTLQPQRVAANYMTSLMHTSVNALPHMALVSGMLVHNGGHGRLEGVVRTMTESMPAWAIDALFHGFLGVSEGLAAPEQIVPRMEALQQMVRSYLQPDENVYTLGQLWRETASAMRQEEMPEGLQQISSLVNEGRVGRETFRMIQGAALEPRSVFAFTGADIANLDAVQNMLQDPDTARRELPLALNRFFAEADAAFGGALRSRTAYTGEPAFFTRLNQEDTLTQGIHDWMRQYYRAITGSESVQAETPAYEQGLEARRNYVRDSMTSVLGLAGTAFLARSVFRYVNEGAPANPDEQRAFGEPDQEDLDTVRGRWSERYRPVRLGRQQNWYMAEGQSGPPAREAFQQQPVEHQGPDDQLEPINEEDMFIGDLQDELGNDPRTPRRRVVDEVLEPINRIVRNHDRAVILQDPNRRNSRQEAVRHAVGTGLLALNEMAPNEWHYLRGRLQALREEQPPAAFDRRRPYAPYSMFTASDLAHDDPDIRNDSVETLGGDRRMRGPGLGFQPGEGGWRERTRAAEQQDPVIGLTGPG